MTDIATPTQHRRPQLQTPPETPAETNTALATVHDGSDAITVSAVRRLGTAAAHFANAPGGKEHDHELAGRSR